MPIDYKKYPPNWKTEIRPRILKRADNCCEFCGAENYAMIRRHKDDHEKYIYVTERPEDYTPSKGVEKAINKRYNQPIKVILTVAHLDHDPENWDVSDDKLKALCQRCHLNYDREHKS